MMLMTLSPHLVNMPFKNGTSGNPIGRPKGSLSTTTKLIREHISQAIDGNKVKQMLVSYRVY